MAIPMAVIRAGRRVVFERRGACLRAGLRDCARGVRPQDRGSSPARCSSCDGRDSAVPLSTPQVIVSLVSHKALRWLSPAFATGAFVSSAALANASHAYAAAVAAQLALLALGLPAARRPCAGTASSRSPIISA